MSKRNDGGPAFPFVSEKGTYTGHDFVREKTPGMSLRDWFAGQALAGIAQTYTAAAFRDRWDVTYEEASKHAYDYADAMLAVRKGAE